MLVYMEPITDTAARPTVDEPTSPAAPATRPRFRLHRSPTDRMIAGVCGGLAESLGVDATLLRIGLVALTILGFGFGIVFYVAAWIIAPVEDQAG